MDDKLNAVLDLYYELILKERQDHADGISRPASERFMAVGPQTGQLINILARNLKAPTILELGTSFGYSTLWLAEAARRTGGRVITMELEREKVAFARDMAARAGVEEHIEYRIGDAVEMISELKDGIDFVLLDLWKDLYVPCLEALRPHLRPGAVLVADNMVIPGGEDARRYQEFVRSQPGILSVPLSVGTGLEVSRFLPG
ncbi:MULTISPECIES: O-methyltransferase [Gluconobacter]|uniref:O-methyltransferase n=1 Tax=Gluconobacter TaxID=441 RepID=UPI000A38EFEB|nr:MULTISPECIES: class I SAM-dependent methyltransferase [Gluconobacter]MBS1037703.1 DUF1442 domain-containing protein [Gluconobacter cerinus]OUJ08107.1 methyltransferase [Gluconobacter sp. DsW_058]